MIGSYYFWKWAEDDTPGPPGEVHAALLRGHLHPAIQTFDARRLVRQLERAAAARRAVGEQWDWQCLGGATPSAASAIFVTCPRVNATEATQRRFTKAFRGLGLSGYDESTGHVIPGLPPKRNCFISGQLPEERHYDITADDLPFLIRRIDPRASDPFGILEDRRSFFVQCYAEGRRYAVEWAQNHEHPKTIYDQWRAQDGERLAAFGKPYQGEKIRLEADPDLLRYEDTRAIFAAFLRGEPRPAKYHWRNVNLFAAGSDQSRDGEPKKS